ncbi:MAG: putative rane protein [Planctomycetota bacterium]|nr:putative rane protein [Planctomycetota bacterium]
MDWLLRRLADRLGVAPAQAGEAITPRIQFEQPWSQWLLALVVIGSAALIIWLYRREGSAPMWYKMMLATMRIVLVLLAVFMLSEAVLSIERTGLPYFIVMTDDSASATVVDQYADPKAKAAAGALARAAGKSETQATRLAVAQGILLKDNAALIKALEQQHKVKLYRASNDAVSLAEVDRPEDLKKAIEQINGITPQGDQTRLGVALRQVLTELRGVPPTAVLILSDGQTTDGEPLAKAAELAKQKGVPIFAVGLGDPEPARDLELTDMLVDEVVFVDDIVRFEAKLLSRGFPGQPVSIKLKRKLAGSNRTEDIETISVTAPPDGQSKKIEIVHRPRETGEITYIIEVEQRERELQTDNNLVSRVVNVRKEKLKVLLIDGEPRYEFRYLKSFLERDRTIDLKVVLLSSDVEYAEQDPYALPGFPTLKDGPDGLFSYDVVILGDADPGFLNGAQMKNLVEFVTQKGGGLLFVAGENFNPLSYKRTPLEPLLPILLNDARNPVGGGVVVPAFRPVLTTEGASHPIFRFGDDVTSSRLIWEKLPELNWYLDAPKKQPAAFVLAAHPTAKAADGQALPIILYQFNGAGKVMFNAVDDTWRWRFRVGDNGPFGRFWIQTIRFLARSKMLGQKQAEVTTDRKRYTRNQSVQIQVRFPNPGIAPTSGGVSVDVKKKGEGPRKVALKAAAGSKNVFEGVLPQLPEGEYDVQLLPPPVLTGGLPTTTFRVDPPAGERERVQMNEPELRRATAATGGKFYTVQTLGTLLDDLPEPQKVPLDTDPPIPIWDTWPILLLFLAVAAMEWVFRKRKQMV